MSILPVTGKMPVPRNIVGHIVSDLSDISYICADISDLIVWEKSRHFRLYQIYNYSTLMYQMSKNQSKNMSQTWEPAEDGVHEYQQAHNPKSDGTYTVVIRPIGQSTRYPHATFDYNPTTGDLTYNHISFSKRLRSGTRENVQIAIAYLKSEGVL